MVKPTQEAEVRSRLPETFRRSRLHESASNEETIPLLSHEEFLVSPAQSPPPEISAYSMLFWCELALFQPCSGSVLSTGVCRESFRSCFLEVSFLLKTLRTDIFFPSFYINKILIMIIT